MTDKKIDKNDRLAAHSTLMKLLSAWARNLMALGVLLMIVGVVCDVGMQVVKHSETTEQAGLPSTAVKGAEPHNKVESGITGRDIWHAVGDTVAKLITEVGVAFFVLGGVGFLFETDEMKAYFDHRVEASLKAEGWKEDFLSRVRKSLEAHEWKGSIFRRILFAELLDKNSHKPSSAGQKSMDAIKVLSDLEKTNVDPVTQIEIDSLVDHHKEIIGAIADGYKANMVIKIEYYADGPDTFRVRDWTDYDVRRGRDRRTPEMIHAAGLGELLSVRSADFLRLHKNNWISVLTSTEDIANRDTSIDRCFVVPLRKDITDEPDLKRVRVFVEYTIDRKALLTWKSKVPVFNYSLTIVPPEGYLTKVSRFMPQKEEEGPPPPKEEMAIAPLDAPDLRIGEFTESFQKWNMPYQGVAWSFVKIGDQAESPSAPSVERTSA